MTDEQCVALIAGAMRGVLVLADVLSRKGLIGGLEVQQMDNLQAAEMAADLFKKAKAAL